ncbi:MAG: hypothetical protein US74_C0025G0010 [Parcubacteria group bacterium GW2011_GWA2_38_13]|nr:MAG: hypothetical protein US74_C0025G0010 [Parcubacteria group bacterium GW2011_GWA2_38_13]
MTKLIQLKLLKIKYSGDSIGDDIRVEIEILNQSLRVDKIIKIGATAETNKEIGRFETDQKIFKAIARITAIEKDLLFNDVGSIDGNIEIDTSIARPHQFVYKVQIKEIRSVLGKNWGKAVAIFEITLEAIVAEAILYVSFEQARNGWIWARKKEDSKILIDLPAYLKVKLEAIDIKRQHFTILEGPWRDTRASVEIQKDGTSYFESTNRHTDPVYLLYSLSQKTLKYKNKVYKVREYKNDPQPWKKTLYDIEIPDYYHKAGRNYLDRSELAPVWFKTTHPSGNRYVHSGANSLGCITLTEVERWDELCKILMRARKGDGKSVGTLEVVV